MNGLILIKNKENNYCGFDRSFSICKCIKNKFPVIEDYYVNIDYINEMVSYYKAENQKLNDSSLICFSKMKFNHDKFRLIGFDCGYIYDQYSSFFVGFSTIVNELIRMENDFCYQYKIFLNDFLLFDTIEKALEYNEKRKEALICNKYHFEDAFEGLTIASIYQYVDGGR